MAWYVVFASVAAIAAGIGYNVFPGPGILAVYVVTSIVWLHNIPLLRERYYTAINKRVETKHDEK